MAPRIGEDFVDWKPPTGGDRTLGLVDFALFPHLDNANMPDNSLVNAEKWAVGVGVPAYAIDDQTAIVVRDGAVEVVSEGHWKRFTRLRGMGTSSFLRPKRARSIHGAPRYLLVQAVPCLIHSGPLCARLTGPAFALLVTRISCTR